MNLTKDQIRQYFIARLPKERIAATAQVSVHCPFHQDKTASLSINLEKGVWRCHASCGSGGMVDFERELSHCDKEQAWANICELVGLPQKNIFRAQPEAVYQYHDAFGRLVFEKLRYPGKDFRQRRPDGKGGWEYSLGNCAKPLYRLPEVITAEYVFICEGEKDADNVRALNIGTPEHPLAVTTNFDGASHWREEYAPCFASKKVVILPDNDEIGKEHAQTIARSVSHYAASVKVVHLPGLLEKQDVSDYLTIHTREDLIAEIKQAPRWVPTAEGERKRTIQSTYAFNISKREEVSWLVQGAIQSRANGLICAVPKAGKSWIAAALGCSLAMGAPWLDCAVPRKVKTALISREDDPGLTSWRTRQISLYLESIGFSIEDYADNFWINTREHTPTFLLDNAEEVSELVTDLKAEHIEFAIFDVFNVLHHADENDNQEMRKVIDSLNSIQRAVGCSIGVVHHFNKDESGPLIHRARGSSAIGGWAEWMLGITMADKETKTRRIEFEGKAALALEDIYFQINPDPKTGYSRPERCSALPQVNSSSAAGIMARAKRPH